MKLPRLGRDREFRHLWRQSAPLALGLVFANGGLLVDQLCASLAGSGGVSTLGYGNKLAGMLVAVAAAPLSVAVLPYFSSLAARDDVGGMRRTLRYWSIVVAVASAPVALGVIFLSEPIVRLLFERGSFTAANTTAVFPVQQLSLLQLPFYLLGTLGSRMLNALRMNNSLLLIAAFNFVVNGALDLGLLHLMGVPGIALAKSIVSAISSVLVFRAVDRRLTIQPLPALQR